MGLYEVVLRGEYFSQRTINRWNYVSSGDEGTSQPSFELFDLMGWNDVAGDFPNPSIAFYLQAIVASAFKFVAVQIKNIYEPTDFYEAFFVDNPVGAGSGDANSPVLAYGFVSNQITLAIAKGHKRFAGVMENASETGGVVTSSVYGIMGDLAVSMSATLNNVSGGADQDFVPAVCQKERYLSSSDPDRYAYRYYATEATQIEHTAVGIAWSPVQTLRSQVSRQYGRGI